MPRTTRLVRGICFFEGLTLRNWVGAPLVEPPLQVTEAYGLWSLSTVGPPERSWAHGIEHWPHRLGGRHCALRHRLFSARTPRRHASYLLGIGLAREPDEPDEVQLTLRRRTRQLLQPFLLPSSRKGLLVNRPPVSGSLLAAPLPPIWSAGPFPFRAPQPTCRRVPTAADLHHLRSIVRHYGGTSAQVSRKVLLLAFAYQQPWRLAADRLDSRSLGLPCGQRSAQNGRIS